MSTPFLSAAEARKLTLDSLVRMERYEEAATLRSSMIEAGEIDWIDKALATAARIDAILDNLLNEKGGINTPEK